MKLHDVPTLPAIYQVYGIAIRSQWPLSQSPRSDLCAPMVDLIEEREEFFEDARREASCHPPATGELSEHVPLSDGSDYVRWFGLFEFLVSTDGRRIYGRSLGNGPFEAFQMYLLGSILAFSLLKLGLDPLHASAVVVDGKAVGFLGNTGYGKSSLTGAFVQAGYPLLTDDVLVTRESGREVMAYSGPARIKLYPEVAQALLGAEANGVAMHPLTRKQIIPLPAGAVFADGVPLQVLYALPLPEAGPGPGPRKKHSDSSAPSVLNENAEVSIRTLRPQEAFIQLVASAFNDVVLGKRRLERHFDLITRLASRIPVKQLSYPRVFDALPAVRQSILDDVREDSGRV